MNPLTEIEQPQECYTEHLPEKQHIDGEAYVQHDSLVLITEGGLDRWRSRQPEHGRHNQDEAFGSQERQEYAQESPACELNSDRATPDVDVHAWGRRGHDSIDIDAIERRDCRESCDVEAGQGLHEAEYLGEQPRVSENDDRFEI